MFFRSEGRLVFDPLTSTYCTYYEYSTAMTSREIKAQQQRRA